MKHLLLFGILLASITVAAMSCPEVVRSGLAVDPNVAFVGSLPKSFTEEDFERESVALKSSFISGTNIVVFDRIKDWTNNGPISTPVRDFIINNSQFKKDFSEQQNIGVVITLEKFSVGDYPNNHSNSKTFHSDAPILSDSPAYLFAVSPGDELIAPTAIYGGPDFAEVTDIQGHLVPSAITIPTELMPYIFTLRNAQLLKMFGRTLHTRTPAHKSGWRYFVRVMAKDKAAN